MTNNRSQPSLSEHSISAHVAQLVELALSEDIGQGDVTTEALVELTAISSAEIYAKEACVICGLHIAEYVFLKLDPTIKFKSSLIDGQHVVPGQCLAKIEGHLQAILTGERTALNFLQRLSAIATKTDKFIQLIGNEKVQLLDTRKTTPGLRELEKYAVKVGGGVNHRFGLYDAVLIKNNHVDALGGDVARAVNLARQKFSGSVEVEVRSILELEQALSAGPDRILFDNMAPVELAKGVKIARSKNPGIFLEASGGINEQTVRDYAQTGVDAVSVGSLTHSLSAIDLSLRYLPEKKREN